MSRARTYAKNLTANWVGYAANLAVMFFMSPFVVHRLGDVDYGIWSLMMSLTGYLGLVELGTRAGVGRFINFYFGKDDPARVNAVISTGMVIYAGMGGVLLVAALTLAGLLGSIFPKIPPDALPAARLICLLIGLNLWLAFISSPARQVLTAFERFELTNGVDLLVTAVRTVATIAALLAGYGLIALAVIQVAGSVLGLTCVHLLARRVFPAMTIRLTLASRATFRELFGFSIWAFVSGMGNKLLYSADKVVIAILLGPALVTYYAIGGMLLWKVRDAVHQSTTIFNPRMMQDCARQDWAALRIDYRRASNLAMAIGILGLGGMIAFGREFITLWMGPRFVENGSYAVLAVLASSSLVAVGFSMGSPIYSGLNRIRLSAMLVFSQGLSNLVLTLVLVIGLDMGIVGVAWGTFYPRIVWAGLAGWFAMRWIRMSFWRFCGTTVVRWAGLGTAFGAVCFGLNLLPLASAWPTFFAKVALACAAYAPLAWIILLDAEIKGRIRTALVRRWPGRSLPRPLPKGDGDLVASHGSILADAKRD